VDTCLFDPVPSSNPDREDIEATAPGSCRRCPSLTACLRWFPLLGWRAQHSQSHYAAAKAGVLALTRCSAIEAAEYGVRINAVSPSIARHKFLDKTTSADLLDRLSAGEAFGRAAEPWEVAATIAFLASDYSSYLTGEVISVSIDAKKARHQAAGVEQAREFAGQAGF